MYLEHFGLREFPFNLTADPSFLYLSKRHQAAFAHLLYGIQERKGFIEITGDVGTGKTTLCRALLRSLNQDVTKTALILNSKMSTLELLQAIIADLGVQVPTKSRLAIINRLNEFLLEEFARGHNTIVIIDEAQNLSAGQLEQIRLLSNLETEKAKLLQLILVGQPQLREKLQREELSQLRQRIAVRYHMLPLEREELPPYIEHRLRVAGYAGESLFSDEAFDALYRYTQGVPRVINVLCDKVFLACFAYQTRRVEPPLVERGIEELEGKFEEVLTP